MTIDWSKPVRTAGDKTPVHIKFTDGRGVHPVAGYIEGSDVLSEWDMNGVCHYLIGGRALTKPLENVPEKIVRYQNIYRHRSGKFTSSGGLYKSPEEALKDRSAIDFVACIRIEFEEGEGL